MKISLFATLISLIVAAPQLVIEEPSTAFPAGFKLCSSPSKDQITLDSITVSPSPVHPGENITIALTGTVLVPVLRGSTISVKAKVGVITAQDFTVDLCEYATGDSCPLEKGLRSISFVNPVPKDTPAVTLNVIVKAFNSDGSPIICFQGPIKIVSQ